METKKLIYFESFLAIFHYIGNKLAKLVCISWKLDPVYIRSNSSSAIVLCHILVTWLVLNRSRKSISNSRHVGLRTTVCQWRFRSDSLAIYCCWNLWRWYFAAADVARWRFGTSFVWRHHGRCLLRSCCKLRLMFHHLLTKSLDVFRTAIMNTTFII